MNRKRELKDFSVLWKEKSDYFYFLLSELLSCITYVRTPDILRYDLQTKQEDLPPYLNFAKDLLPFPFPLSKRTSRNNCLSCFKTLKELLPVLREHKNERRQQSRISDHVVFAYLGTFCICMVEIFNYLSACNSKANDIEIIKRAEKFGYEVTKEVYESIGYWTAKIGEKKRLMKNASTISRKRIQNKEIMRRLLKETDNKESREFILQAMKALDRGERSVKNLIREIEAEKNNKGIQDKTEK